MSKNRPPKSPVQFYLPILLAIAALALASLACETSIFADEQKEVGMWLPETPKQYTAEIQNVWEVYVGINNEGYVVPGDIYIGALANMRYRLEFWDVGKQVPGKETATIYQVYTIREVYDVSPSLNLSREQEQALLARTDFPVTIVPMDYGMVFTGGPEGLFLGNNPANGELIQGSLKWVPEEKKMYAMFTEGITQNYMILLDEPFYNWP